MENFIGLYHPFIHFHDEGWLKTAALYWDRIKRIVPDGYPVRDSSIVKELVDETGLVQDVPPGDHEWQVRDQFVPFITSHARKLQQRYGLDRRKDWKDDEITKRWGPKAGDKRLAYVHFQKTWPQLRDALRTSGLAEVIEQEGQKLIGMHPKIADIYMAILAERISSDKGWYPITDAPIDQVSVSGFSIERLAAALLDEEDLAQKGPMPHETTAILANLCLRTVIPRNATALPVAKVVELRKQYQPELQAFQGHLASFKDEAAKTLGNVSNKEALTEHLQLHYEKAIKPRIEEVRKAFKVMKVDTATSITSVAFTVPAIIGAKAFNADPVVGGIAGFSLGVVPIIQKRRDEAQTARSSPGAWLLRIEEALEPRNLRTRFRRSARKFILGV